MRRLSLHTVNDLLLASIAVVTFYIILAPLAPRLDYWWQSHHSQRQAILQRAATTPPSTTPSSLASQPAVMVDRLIVPSMLFDQPIHEAAVKDRYTALKQGVWRYPNSSTPDKGGNTVLLAHRFTYTNPRGAFYFLDKVKLDDTIAVGWKGKLYTYRVASVQTVAATDTAIQASSGDTRLTLYTCTPLWHPMERLVVVAKLVRSS